MPTPDGRPILHVDDAAAFAQWMQDNHASSAGIWLAIPKKGGNGAGASYSEALDESLRFGWIDSQKRKLDDDYFLQRFTPRTARSRWSKVNVDKVAALVAAGRMEATGLAEVARAKADGRWEAAYAPPSEATVPDDFRAALDANPAAAAFFDTLSGSKRFVMLFQIHDAKRAETRARRIDKFVGMCARGELVR